MAVILPSRFGEKLWVVELKSAVFSSSGTFIQVPPLSFFSGVQLQLFSLLPVVGWTVATFLLSTLLPEVVPLPKCRFRRDSYSVFLVSVMVPCL